MFFFFYPLIYFFLSRQQLIRWSYDFVKGFLSWWSRSFVYAAK